MTEKHNEREELPPLDIRWGIKPLAKYIRKTERQTYHLVSTGKLPVKQVGGRYSWSPDLVRRALLGEAEQ